MSINQVRPIFSQGDGDVGQGEHDIALWDNVFSRLNRGVIIAEAHGDQATIYCNAAFEALTGYSKEEVLGKNCRFLQGEESDADVIATIREEIKSGNSLQVTIKNYRKDGTPFWNALEISPIHDANGQPSHFMGVITDVTDQQFTQEQYRKQTSVLERRIEERTEALRVREERYKIATQAAQIGVWDWNLETGEVYVDPLLKHQLGYKEGEVLDEMRVWIRHIHPDDYRRVRASAEAHIRGEIPVFEAEHRMLHKDGSVIWISARGSVLHDESGKPYRMVGTDMDITSRKEAEAARARFRTMLDSANDAVFLIRPEDGAFIDCNETAYRQLGYDRPELLLMRVIDIGGTVTDDEAWQSQVQRIQASGGPYIMEGLLKRKDGSTFPVEISVIAKTLDETEYLFAVARDIAARKQAEQALHESEARFRTMADTAPLLIWTAGVDTLCTYFNRRWLEFRGRTLQDELGDGWAAGLHPDDLEAYLESYITAFGGRQQFEAEFRLMRHDGIYRWIYTGGAPRYLPDGSFAGYIGSCIDITERKEAEEALRESKEKFRIVAESVPVSIFIIQGDQYVYGNDASIALTGYSREEWSSMRFFDVVHPDYREEVKARGLARQRGEPVDSQYEIKIVRKDGAERWVLLRLSSVSFNGKAAGLGTAVDITERTEAEQALRASEARLAESQRLAHLGHWDWDIRNRVQHWTDETYRILGLKPRQMEAHFDTFLMHIHQDDRKRVEDETRRALENADDLCIEYRLVWPNGQVRSARGEGLIERGETGEAIRMAGTVQDITERKEAEEALRESEERWRRLVENHPDPMVLTDEGELLYINPAGVSLLGASSVEDLVGRSAYDFFLDPVEEELARERIRVLQRGETVEPREYKLTRLDGEHRIAEMSSVQITYGGRQVIQTVARDITIRKEAEKALQESEDRWRRLVENHPETIMISVDGDIVFTNSAGAKVYGAASPEELVGHSVFEFIVPELHGIFQQRKEALIQGEPTTRREHVIVRMDGEVRNVEAFSVPITYQGQHAAQTVIYDITERKKAEQLKDQYARQSRALADAALLINAQHTVAEVIEIAAQVALEIFEVHQAVIALIDYVKDGSQVYHVARSKQFSSQLPDAKPSQIYAFSKHVWKEKRTVHYSREALEKLGIEELVLTEQPPLEEWLGAPIDGGDEELMGAVHLADKCNRSFTEIDRITLGQMAMIVREALANVRLYEEVKAKRERAQLLSRKLVEVQEGERRHIARELHDEVGQTLTVLKLLLRNATTENAEKREHALNEASSGVEELIDKVRQMSLDLRPTMLDHLGIAPALATFFQRYEERAGIHVLFKHTIQDQRFASEVETTAYRIVQEALTNVARYAKVDGVTVRIWTGHEYLTVQIEDEGEGFDLDSTRRKRTGGLSSMEERATALGGHLNIESEPKQGTIITAFLPLVKE